MIITEVETGDWRRYITVEKKENRGWATTSRAVEANGAHSGCPWRAREA
jgi:hypothetical protein